MKKSIANRLALLRVTFIWVGGWLILIALGVLWIGLLVYAIYEIPQARATGDITGHIVGYTFALIVLALVHRRFVIEFAEWHRNQRVGAVLKEIDEWFPATPDNAELDSLVREHTSEFSETFKQQLRDSPTFHATVLEATKLVAEMAAFSAVPHSREEQDAFREAWKAKSEKFAERVAQDDPLAVEVILKAIEKESKRQTTPR